MQAVLVKRPLARELALAQTMIVQAAFASLASRTRAIRRTHTRRLGISRWCIKEMLYLASRTYFPKTDILVSYIQIWLTTFRIAGPSAYYDHIGIKPTLYSTFTQIANTP